MYVLYMLNAKYQSVCVLVFIVGVASIGPQSCIATAIAKSFLQVSPQLFALPYLGAVTLTCLSDQVEAAASKVTYHDSLQKLTLPSLTMQHYFVSAAGTRAGSEQAFHTRYDCMYVCTYVWYAATCTYIGGPAGQAACQTLANLCVLQMFDLTRLTHDTFASVFISLSQCLCPCLC